MFSLANMGNGPARNEKKSARKELRMRPSDAERIRQAAASQGLSETDFITRAALMQAAETNAQHTVSFLAPEDFTALQAALDAPARNIAGLATAAKATRGLLQDG